MCVTCGFLTILVELDSDMLCKMVNGSLLVPWMIDAIVRDIGFWMTQGNFSLHHALCKANSMTDCSVHLGSNTFTSHSFTSSHYPSSLGEIFYLDRCDVPLVRWKFA
ncbi:hypothetical protein ACH5RR_026257 [Cinchona calisaya]|uniref:RNase H type-1 domain-containing protein n=1 Tax=Cinchona calisaya TaxID=153742 RepID=A0ABD2Z5G5_9GENT